MAEGARDTMASPYTQKLQDVEGEDFTPTVKAFNNKMFLRSRQGRLVRVLCEFEEPAGRLRRHNVRSTVLVFGSARAMTTAAYARTLQAHEASLAAAQTDGAKERCEEELRRLRSTQWMCSWVDEVERLARGITEFAMAEKKMINASFTHLPDYFRPAFSEMNNDEGDGTSAKRSEDMFCDLVVTTGGGPGFMEAANKGAASVAGAQTMGMGISLPFEKGLNPYITQDLAFEFHYFFTRKFWLMYSCRAVVIAPGGFGTMDEMFELFTLRQTKKIPDIPIILLGSTFWKTVVNWEALAEFGTVSRQEIDSLCFADTADEALAFIKNFFSSEAEEFAWSRTH